MQKQHAQALAQAVFGPYLGKHRVDLEGSIYSQKTACFTRLWVRNWRDDSSPLQHIVGTDDLRDTKAQFIAAVGLSASLQEFLHCVGTEVKCGGKTVPLAASDGFLRPILGTRLQPPKDYIEMCCAFNCWLNTDCGVQFVGRVHNNYTHIDKRLAQRYGVSTK